MTSRTRDEHGISNGFAASLLPRLPGFERQEFHDASKMGDDGQTEHTAVSSAISSSSMSHLTHSRTDGNTAGVGRSWLDLFDAVPLRLIPTL